MENKSLNNLDLPFKLWPGTAIANKLILNDRTVKKTIIQELLGNEDFSVHEGLVLLREIAFRLGTDNESYRSAWTEWPDGTYSDVLYVPGRVTEDRPPVLVEIQDTVDQAFMLRLIQHCTLVVERYKVLPVVLVLVTVGFSQQTLRGKLIPHSKVHYLLEAKCEFWAQRMSFISSESIENHLDKGMNKLVALAYFVTRQTPDINSLEFADDPTVKSLYSICKTSTRRKDDSQMIQIFNQGSTKREVELNSNILNVAAKKSESSVKDQVIRWFVLFITLLKIAVVAIYALFALYYIYLCLPMFLYLLGELKNRYVALFEDLFFFFWT